MLNCSLLLDAPTTTWVDSILASGSDASPFTGVPPTGRRSSFGGFLFLGGSAFLPTGVRRSMSSVLPSPAVADLGSVNASSVVWIESCSLTQVRSQAATAGTCVTDSVQPGQPAAAFMSLRWTTFYQVDGAAPTLIAVSNATMRAVVDGGAATPMTLALLHSDYSSVSLSTSASAGVGAEFVFDNVVVHGPGATTSINSCRVASASSHPLALGWQALRFGFQSSTSLDPVHFQLKSVHVLQPANISQLRMFSAPLAWKPPLLSSALSSTVISVQCCSIDYVKPISASVFAAPRWAIEVQPPPNENDNEMCPYEGFWTSTLTFHDAPAALVASDKRRNSKTTSTAVGATVVIVSGVASLVSSGVGTTAAAFATSTLAMRLQTSAAAIAMAVRCSVIQDGASDDDMAADLAIGSAVSDNPMQATIESFGPWTSAAGGAVLANAALVVAFGVGGPLVGVGIAAVWRGSDAANDDGHIYRLPSPLTLRSIGGFLLTLVPGQGATVYATLLQPTFASSIALLMAGNYPHVEVLESRADNGGKIVFGTVGFATLLLSATAIVWSVLRAERTGRLRGVDHHAGTASSSIWSMWFRATEWRYAADRRSLHNKNSDDATAFQRRFDSTYSGYRRSYLWFLACEWGVALLCGLLAALSTLPSILNNPSACTGLVWGVAAISAVLALCVLVLRPYSSKFDNTNNIVQCTSTAIVAVLAAALPSDGDAANDAANVVVILQTTLLALGAAIEIAHDVFASVRCFGAPTFQNTATQRGAARMGFRQSARSLNASFEFSYQICSVVEKNRESQATPWSSSVRQERVLQELISMICRVEQQQH
ncbi:transmembrane protein, putative [Bodo saltans]|uniref:Transmembrane protein, putative n=1 Tax=Bodo saltans TaxID=75058 RepID=A0A0S4JPJ7_BODSA|nr:transmembrane protein, putative [Bodo saltans]|eukprot:CUG92103.1 transmembrane protein, putative [Bodo saltans]